MERKQAFLDTVLASGKKDSGNQSMSLNPFGLSPTNYPNMGQGLIDQIFEETKGLNGAAVNPWGKFYEDWESPNFPRINPLIEEENPMITSNAYSPRMDGQEETTKLESELLSSPKTEIGNSPEKEDSLKSELTKKPS